MKSSRIFNVKSTGFFFEKALCGLAVHSKRLKYSLLSIVAFFISANCYSLGLGSMESKSFLGQPLNSEVSLVNGGKPIDVRDLIVRQVPSNEAADLGVDVYSGGYRFDVKLNSEQEPAVVVITTQNSINEPYLNVLIELRWPSGVVYREYAILLDPPPLIPESESKVSEQASSAVTAPASKPAAVTPPRQTRPVTRPTLPEPSTAKPSTKAMDTSDDRYKVQSGDTLYRIAERWSRGTEQSRSETMDWLYDNNPRAFIRGDKNRLLAGAILSMPDLSRIAVDEPSLTPPVAANDQLESSTAAQPIAASEEGDLEEAAEATAAFADEELSAVAKPERGLLVVDSGNSDDKSRELIDMLVRENDDLKARMENLQNSEYLETLQQLVALQRRQISELREQLTEIEAGGSDAEAAVSENIDTQAELARLDQEVGELPENTGEIASIGDDEESGLVSESAQDEVKAPVNFEPVLVTEETGFDRTMVIWIVLGAGVLLFVVFYLFLNYYRRLVPTHNYAEENIVEVDSVGRISARESIDALPMVDDEVLDSTVTVSTIKDSAKEGASEQSDQDWLGEKVEEIEGFDESAFDEAIREVEDIFESLTLDDQVLEDLEDDSSSGRLGSVGSDFADELSQEITSELQDDSLNLDELDQLEKGSEFIEQKKERRSDSEVLSSIAEKMSQYSPTEVAELGLGVMELDEEEAHEDDVSSIIYRAKIFVEFGKFDSARDLVSKGMKQQPDERLDAFMVVIDEAQAEKSAPVDTAENTSEAEAPADEATTANDEDPATEVFRVKEAPTKEATPDGAELDAELDIDDLVELGDDVLDMDDDSEEGGRPDGDDDGSKVRVG